MQCPTFRRAGVLLTALCVVLSSRSAASNVSATAASTPQTIALVAPIPTCNGLTATIYDGNGGVFAGGVWTFTGTAGDDVIVGTSGDDTINGDAGNDTICGVGGNDTINGDAGNDYLLGGPGADSIHGGGDNDRVLFDATDSNIQGGTGYDRAEAQGSAPVTVSDAGGQGFEIVLGTPGADTLTTITPPDGANRVVMYGRSGDDTLTGSAQVDTLLGDGGADTLRGNGGNDRIYFDADDLVILGGPDFDEALAQGITPVTFDVGGNGFERAEGTPGDDIFTSSGSVGVTILGKGGADDITGSSGADYLEGNDGADSLQGGSGNDVVRFDADDSLVNGGAGYDRAEAQGTTGVTVADAGGQGFEMVVGTSAGDTFTTSTAPDGASRIVIYGRAGNDTITGSNGSDTLLGDAGADTLRGNGGDDRIYFDVDDLVILGGPGFDEALAQGADPVTFDVGGNGFERTEGTSGNDTFTSSTIPDSAPGVTILGRSGADDITGSSGPDILGGNSVVNINDADGTGADGMADVLRGEGGDDIIGFDSADTTVLGGTGYDRAVAQGTIGVTLDVGGSGFERVDGTRGADTFTSSVVPAGATGVEFWGHNGNDDITGSSGNDTMSGLFGFDTLRGAGGNDRIYFDSDDTIEGGAGYDRAEAQGTVGVTMADAGGQGFEIVVGTSAADSLTTVTAPDGAARIVMYGRGGDDTLTGSAQADTLLGDAGADTLRGNDGNDRIYFDVDDLVILGGPGFDEALAQGADPVTFDVGGNGFERAEGTSGNDTFTSSTLPDSAPGVTIRGRSGADELAGSPGDDTMTGGLGADHFSGGKGIDTATDFNPGEGDTKDADVENPNFPPVAVDDNITVNEDSGATAIDVLANDTDTDGGPKSIASVTQPANGTVAITGGGTGLTYAPDANYCNTPPGTTLDTFTYTLTPGTDSATVTVTVTCVDDNPDAVDDSATVAEDSGATAIDVLPNDTDQENDAFTISSVTQPANGTVVITGGGTGLTYAPDGNYCNTPPGTTLDTFTYTLTPGADSATVTVTVTCTDDNPDAVDDSATVAEDSSATAIDVLANDTDTDGGPKSIASVTQPANGTVVITGGGTGLTYAPDGNYCNTPPGTTLDTFTYTLTPGADSATVSVTVTCVDDNPDAVDDSATVAEDSGATAIDVLTNDTDPDGGPKSIASVTQPANGTVAITGGGNGMTYQPSPNYCNTPPGTTLDTFTYTLTPGADSATVSVTVTCVNDPPVASSDAFDFIGNTLLKVDQSADSNPEVRLTTSGTHGVLNNDDDPVEGDSVSVVGIVGSADQTSPFVGATANGGSVSIDSDGSFFYTPKDGDTAASDSFQYKLSDGTDSVNGTVTLTRFTRVWYVKNNAAAGGLGRSTDPFDTLAEAETASGDGDTIYVFAGNGTTTGQTSGITLKSSQRLIGEGVALSVPVAVNGGSSPTQLRAAESQPQIGNSSAGGNGVSASNISNIEIRGLSIAGDANAIDVTRTNDTTGSVTIRDNTIRAAGAEGIDINSNVGSTGTLNLDVQNNTWTASTGNGFDARSPAGTLQVTFSNNTGIRSTTNAVLLDGVGGTLQIVGFANNTVHQDTAGAGFVISDATFDTTPGDTYQTLNAGTTVVGTSGDGVGSNGMMLTNVRGDLSFSDLDIFASNGSGLRTTSSATFNAGTGTGFRIAVAATQGTIDATGGPAVDISTAQVDLQLQSLKSINSATTGLSLTSVNGTFSAASESSIANATGTDFSVSNSNATVTYGGTISDSSGSGSGVSLTNNSGSTITLSGVLTLSTASGNALTATGGGTVNVTASTNILATTTGTALNVANTTIGAGGLKFQSIAADGAANGIILNNTGSTGGLTVTGTGSANSGGTIQNTTADAISLSNTFNVSLSSMNIQNIARNGIDGTTVVNFSFLNGVINNVGTAAAGEYEESGIAFNNSVSFTENNVSGNVTITGSTITNPRRRAIHISNWAGTINNMIISNNTLTSSTSATASLGDAIQVLSQGSASTTAHILAGTIADNVITNFPSGAGIFVGGGNTASSTSSSLGIPGGTSISITGNRVTGESAVNRLGTNAIAVSFNGCNGQSNFVISNNGTVANPLTNFGGLGISVFMGGTVNSTATVDNNVIVSNNTAGSSGIGVQVDQACSVNDAGTATMTVTNNSITNNEGTGIRGIARASNGTLRLKVQNNTVAAPTLPNRNGIRIDSGSATGNTSVCLNISGNTSAGSGVNKGIGLRKQGTVSSVNVFAVHGMAATSTPGVEAYVDGQNGAGGGTELISATSGFSNCSFP